MSTILIGIAGGTGSGKTTLTRHLKEHFGPEVTVIGHDNYYKRQDGKTLEERAKVNYDHPAAFDTELLIEHLKELKEGRPIRCPVYSYVEHNRTEETREILPTKVIIVEGILIFQNPTLRDMFDIKIFVETDADVRILRRALQDVEERGRTLQSVVTQYLTTVKPMHEQYVEPSRKFADIIVLEGGRNLVALEMIMQRIQAHIKSGVQLLCLRGKALCRSLPEVTGKISLLHRLTSTSFNSPLFVISRRRTSPSARTSRCPVDSVPWSI